MPMTLNGTSGMTAPQGAVYNGLQTMTSQPSTSGTSLDFTGIPLWVKRVTVIFNNVYSSGNSHFLVQIGSGSVLTSTYVSSSARAGGTDNANGTGSPSTAGFIIQNRGAGTAFYGNMIITNITGNTWVSSSSIGLNTNYAIMGGGGVTLSGSLDRVRFTTVNGTDTFSSGSVNVMYE